jgi:hypothetical protein
MGILGDTFENLVGSLYVSYIVLLPTEQAEIAYTQAPDWLRQYAFDLLQRIWGNIITEGAKAGGRSFAARFPEPAGMKDFRERRAREIADREANRVRPNTDLK